jgi:hypothetical protein
VRRQVLSRGLNNCGADQWVTLGVAAAALPFSLSVPPRCSRGLAGLPRCPGPPAHRGQRPPATGATVSTTFSQKKRNSRESAQDRCFCCRKSGACPPRHGVGASPSAPALPPCVGAVGGRLAAVSVCCPVCLKRSWGRRAQPGGGWSAHRVAAGAPARLLGRGHWCSARGGMSLLFLPGPPAHRDSTGPGNGSNGPPQPSPKKENTGEACGNTLPPLLPLPCGCRCSRPSACCCVAAVRRVLPRCAAPRSRRRCCVAALRTQPLLPVAKLRISR